MFLPAQPTDRARPTELSAPIRYTMNAGPAEQFGPWWERFLASADLSEPGGAIPHASSQRSGCFVEFVYLSAAPKARSSSRSAAPSTSDYCLGKTQKQDRPYDSSSGA